MKLIIPMAGQGKRLRPQSNVTPKPLLTVRGKSMVERIVAGFASALERRVTDSVFILSPSFGKDITEKLTDIATRYNVTPHFVVQHDPLGTAHAVAVADEHLIGEGIVVYADTVFEMDPVVGLELSDVVAWVKEVDDPRRFGVAVRQEDRIVAFVEKPQEPISNEALIGIYYVRDLAKLKSFIQVLFDQKICGKGGEYYLTDAFDLMLKDGLVFRTAGVRSWLDCGTLKAFQDTVKYLLMHEPQDVRRVGTSGSVLVEPVYLAEGAEVTGSVIGPNVCIESGARVDHSVIRNSIIFEGAYVSNAVLDNSLIGSNSTIVHPPMVFNVGDFSDVL